MDPQELRNMLEKLHAELKQTESIDEQGRQMLHSLIHDIQEVLARSGEDESLYPPLSRRLAEAVKHFEVSHPKLTLAIGQALDILSQAGF